MDQQELKNVLELHRQWVMGEASGKRADLSSADLSSADLSSANLSSANLRSANLRSANLNYANLSSANLRYANLSSADLSSANLSSADLSSADLSSANLRYANLKNIIEDFYKKISLAKNEIPGLYDALIRGKINGSAYEGECACFCGTIANIRKENYQKMGIDLRPDADSPTERWFMAINTGDIPQSNQVSKLTTEWIEKYCTENSIVLPKYKLISSVEFPQVFGE